MFGVADLAVVSTRPSVLDARIAAGIPPLNYELDAVIFSNLSATRPQTLERLARCVGADDRVIDERIRGHLTRIGAVQRTATGSLSRHRAFVPVGRVHVLEAKMTDWRRAGRQARHYALWADSASVMLGRPPRDMTYLVDELRVATS